MMLAGGLISIMGRLSKVCNLHWLARPRLQAMPSSVDSVPMFHCASCTALKVFSNSARMAGSSLFHQARFTK